MSLVLSLTDELAYQYENDEREGETNQHQSEQLDLFEILLAVKQILLRGKVIFLICEKLFYITDDFVKLL